jgi:hypothetical protein
LATYTRRELQSELAQLAQFPRYVERLDRVETRSSSSPACPRRLLASKSASKRSCAGNE